MGTRFIRVPDPSPEPVEFYDGFSSMSPGLMCTSRPRIAAAVVRRDASCPRIRSEMRASRRRSPASCRPSRVRWTSSARAVAHSSPPSRCTRQVFNSCVLIDLSDAGVFLLFRPVHHRLSGVPVFTAQARVWQVRFFSICTTLPLDGV